MREILFKGKAINRDKSYHRTNYKNGDWVYGLITRLYDEQYENLPAEMTDENGVSRIEIDHNTICQYTGLTDKNGNKIWENDIVRGHSNPDDLAKVVFGEFYVIEVESFEKVDLVVGWHTEVIQTDYLSKCEPFCLPMPLTDFYISISEWEVIGNIFDNPELLEGGAE